MAQPIPPDVLNGLVGQLVTPVPGMQPGGPVENAPSQQPGPAPQPQQPQGPAPEGNPAQQGGKEDSGLNDDQAEMLRSLMADPKARKDIESIVRQVSGDQRNKGRLSIDPDRLLQMAQGWNARMSLLGEHLAQQQGNSPGASKANDESLLLLYWATPLDPSIPEGEEPRFLPLEEIDEYADACRLHFVQQGMKDLDKIEDATTRECFPMRELLIKSGRTHSYQLQVDFVEDMNRLTERWLKRYGKLPRPDYKVLMATKAGKGDPESQARDTDSDPYPA